MPVPAIMPLLATAGVGWLYYRRIRRQFGHQVYRPQRAALRIALLSLLACGLLVAGGSAHRLLPALAIGGMAGAGLGWLALRHMRVWVVDGVRRYVSNPWIGGVVTLLLVARLAWRAYRFEVSAAGTQPLMASPLTYGLVVLLVAYYLVSGIGLVRRMRALPTG